MNDLSKELAVQDERAAEKQYGVLLQQRAGQRRGVDGPASAGWTRTGLPTQRPVGSGRFCGRVALVRPDDEILDGTAEFYLGEDPAVVEGINVFNWRNPIGQTFFRPASADHELCRKVAATRTFRHGGDGLIGDFVDEFLRSDCLVEPFRKRGLAVPAPPNMPKLPKITGDDAPRVEDKPASEDTISPGPALDLSPVRAEALLRDMLLAPRTKSMSSVLATLQPDQYELVTLQGKHSVIIEGHPGTGKTVVATHRAAYLLYEGIPAEQRLNGNILVVGPTPGYSQHVRGVISRLAGDSHRVAVFSLPELADLIIGSSEAPPTGVSRSYLDVGWEMARFARSVIARFEADNGRKPLPAEVFDTMRSRAGTITNNTEWAVHLRGLPEYREAIKLRVHSPLVALIHWELQRPEALANVEHIIVDEAQDVTPLEWLLLDEINEGDHWTLLGDLNQRRSDHTLPDWGQVLDHIAIDTDTPVRRMNRGYRSTKPILEFANRLLPRTERKFNAFQQTGPAPRISPVRQGELGDRTVSEVENLAAKYQNGTVAVIAQSPKSVTVSLRKRGWTSHTFAGDQWSRDSSEVRVLTPDMARGLEFDAVVVVEPAEFPKNFGRQGPLYTALTRANRELAVVHSSKLPDELRRR